MPRRGNIVRRRTTNDQKFLFDNNWAGFFVNSFDPNQQYDPKHFCLDWKPCCMRNFQLMPSHLLKEQTTKNSTINQLTIQQLEKQMEITKTYLLNNINSLNQKHEIEHIIGILQTYTWLCKELLRVKFI